MVSKQFRIALLSLLALVSAALSAEASREVNDQEAAQQIVRDAFDLLELSYHVDVPETPAGIWAYYQFEYSNPNHRAFHEKRAVYGRLASAVSKGLQALEGQGLSSISVPDREAPSPKPTLDEMIERVEEWRRISSNPIVFDGAVTFSNRIRQDIQQMERPYELMREDIDLFRRLLKLNAALSDGDKVRAVLSRARLMLTENLPDWYQKLEPNRARLLREGFGDLEDVVRAWYENLPLSAEDREYLDRRAFWKDRNEPKIFQPHWTETLRARPALEVASYFYSLPPLPEAPTARPEACDQKGSVERRLTKAHARALLRQAIANLDTDQNDGNDFSVGVAFDIARHIREQGDGEYFANDRIVWQDKMALLEEIASILSAPRGGTRSLYLDWQFMMLARKEGLPEQQRAKVASAGFCRLGEVISADLPRSVIDHYLNVGLTYRYLPITIEERLYGYRWAFYWYARQFGVNYGNYPGNIVNEMINLMLIDQPDYDAVARAEISAFNNELFEFTLAAARSVPLSPSHNLNQRFPEQPSDRIVALMNLADFRVGFTQGGRNPHLIRKAKRALAALEHSAAHDYLPNEELAKQIAELRARAEGAQ